MSASPNFLISSERLSARTAALLAACAVVLSFFEAPWLAIAYRLAVFTCLAPAVGSLVLVLIHRITGGQWTGGIAPFLRAAVALLPWVWLFALPVLFLPRPAASGLRHLALTFRDYEGLPMTLLRALVAAVLFFVLKAWLADGVGLPRDPVRNPRPWVGPVGLILVFFMLTFIGDDWLESLEARWHSTAFPVIWTASQAVSGLALALLCGLQCGATPARDGVSGRNLGIDWGNLMLATLMFWAYVTFCQFLIIWSGNLPEEISWYARREAGGWWYVVPAIALFGFAVPFLLLLMRRLKRSISGLSVVAGLLLASQWLYLLWVIAPAQGVPTLPALLLLVAVAGAAAALFINRFVRVVRLEGGLP
jgi:hypothetical protein